MKALRIALVLTILCTVGFALVVKKKYAIGTLTGTADTTIVLPSDFFVRADNFLFRIFGDTVGDGGKCKLLGTFYVKPRGGSWLSFAFAANSRPLHSWTIDTLATHQKVVWYALLLVDSVKVKVAGDSAGQAVKNCSLEVRANW